MCWDLVLAKTPVTSSAPSSQQIANELTAEEHRMAAEYFEETAARLQAKVKHLEERVARFTKKPYLDPKRFRIDGWKRLMGAYRVELAEVQKQIDWHYAQAKDLHDKPLSKGNEEVQKNGNS